MSWTHSNSQVVTPSQLCNLTNVSETSAHDNSLVAVLLVVIEDALHALYTWIFMRCKLALLRRFVPVHDAADKGRDQVCTSLCSGDGLRKGEHEREVAVDLVFRLQDVCSFDAFPSRGDLD